MMEFGHMVNNVIMLILLGQAALIMSFNRAMVVLIFFNNRHYVSNVLIIAFNANNKMIL